MWFSVFPWKKDKVFSYFFVTEMNTLPRWLFVLEEYIGKLNLHIQTDFSFNTFHLFSAFFQNFIDISLSNGFALVSTRQASLCSSDSKL